MADRWRSGHVPQSLCNSLVYFHQDDTARAQKRNVRRPMLGKILYGWERIIYELLNNIPGIDRYGCREYGVNLEERL